MNEQNLNQEETVVNEQNTTEEKRTYSDHYQDYTAEIQPEPVQQQGGTNGQKENNTLAIVSLVLGIVSLVLCCCSGITSVPFGVGGIICAVMSKKNGKSGMATAGMICSIIGVVLGVVSAILGVAVFIALMNDVDVMESTTYYY